MKNLFLVCLIAFALTSYSQNNFTIRGKVINGEDHTPLPWANVFFANTSKGTQTDLEGNFEIHNVPRGRFKLIISFVGFETVSIDLSAAESKMYTVILKPSVKNLKEVVIRSKPIDRTQRNEDLKAFRENFIGQSDNANECIIKNPDVLQFNTDKSVLHVNADSILIIENSGLGYRLKFLIEEFRYNKIEKNVLYKGQVLYEAMQPKSEDQNKLWASHRLKAYYGSEMHFMRALYQRKLAEQGFFVNLYNYDRKGFLKSKAIIDTSFRVKSVAFKNKFKVSTISHYNRLVDSIASTKNETVLAFNGQLEVVYINELESADFSSQRAHRKMGFKFLQYSTLTLQNKKIPVEANGSVLSEENLLTKGYWSWELVSESLPVDYDPDFDSKR
jgi:hypothetical protein